MKNTSKEDDGCIAKQQQQPQQPQQQQAQQLLLARNIRGPVPDNASNLESMMRGASLVNSIAPMPLPGGLQPSQVTADPVQGTKEWHQQAQQGPGMPPQPQTPNAPQPQTVTPNAGLRPTLPVNDGVFDSRDSSDSHSHGLEVKTEPVEIPASASSSMDAPYGEDRNMDDVKTEVKMEPMEDNFSDAPAAAVDKEKEEPSTPMSTASNTNDTSCSDVKPTFGSGNGPDSASTPSSSATAITPIIRPKKAGKVVFSPDELRQSLMPTLEKLFRQDPESLSFRDPVDPQNLGIPDYFDIIKRPMDLSTIKRKLDTGQYKDPWEYVDDVWLMFDNAWLYNRKTSRVYRCCTKLSEVFEQEIDPVMQSLGYCCGRKYTFNPLVLWCCGKQQCSIPRDAKYYSYGRYLLCVKCFNDIPGDAVYDDSTQPSTNIRKDQFIEMKNDALDLEPFVDCQECGRKLHQICVLHINNIWSRGFTCDHCLKGRGEKRKENLFGAKRLPTTKLSMFIENRVNNYLKKMEAGAGEVSIRVVASSDKITKVKPGMKSWFVDNGEMCETFPYRAKALFAFEEIDGTDVCFFGMHVQEYGSECPEPNRRRVYLAYLDSVHFFRPKQFRTAVYHEILLGYLDYVKQLGYCMAHIWACPPSEGVDYIFHRHPPDQKIPKPKRLEDWYKKMLDRGVIEGIVLNYKDILQQAIEDNLTSAAELPYFEGDCWPDLFEFSIEELDQEEEEKRRQAEAADDLSAKIFAKMEKLKEVHFVIHLHSAQAAVSLGPVVDPDPLIQCDLMDGRHPFLTLSRDEHYEFSSLRRCKFSSMAMLNDLHSQGTDRLIF